MSYIRCLSNPERLYIIGTTDGNIEVMEGPDKQNRMMPATIFHTLLKRWYTGYRENVRHKGASIKQRESDFRFELNYTGWAEPIVMYESTLVYICTQNRFRWARN